MIDSRPVKVKVSGFDSLLNGFETLGEAQVLAELDKAMGDAMEHVGKKAKQNYKSRVNSSGRVIEQLRWRNYISQKKQYNVYGQVGYFHIPEVNAKYSDTPNKEIPAPIIGYWLEFGVQPHSLAKGSKAARRATPGGSAREPKGQDKLPWHTGFAGRNILNNAYVSTFEYVNSAFDDVIERLNQRILTAKKVA